MLVVLPFLFSQFASNAVPAVPTGGTVCASVQEMRLEMFVATGSPVSASKTTVKLVNVCVAVWPVPTSYQPVNPGAVSSERGDWLLLMSTLNNCAVATFALNKINRTSRAAGSILRMIQGVLHTCTSLYLLKRQKRMEAWFFKPNPCSRKRLGAQRRVG